MAKKNLFYILVFIVLASIGLTSNSQKSAVLSQKSTIVATPTVIPTVVESSNNAPKTSQDYYQQSTNNINTIQEEETPTPTPTPTPTLIPTPQEDYRSKNRTCTTSGDYTYCSDGTSYLTSGSYTSISGGSNGQSGSCITSGSYTNCSDGSSAIQSGNYKSYSGNGQSGSCIQNGAWTNCSDGSTTYNPNY